MMARAKFVWRKRRCDMCWHWDAKYTVTHKTYKKVGGWFSTGGAEIATRKYLCPACVDVNIRDRRKSGEKALIPGDLNFL